jgi:hypothetical protein
LPDAPDNALALLLRAVRVATVDVVTAGRDGRKDHIVTPWSREVLAPNWIRSGWESRKTYAVMIASRFLDKYLSGEAILEIGYKGGLDDTVPIVPQAIGIDVDYPGYDGVRLPFPDESQHYITIIAAGFCRASLT